MNPNPQFPLNVRFKLATLGSRFWLTDANGQTLAYVKQKMMKLKEDIQIFADEQQTTLLYTMKADRVIDFSPNFTLSKADGSKLGSIKRHGGKSILKASYSVLNSQEVEVMKVTEANPWVKVLDALFSEIPFVGLFTGYLLHPRYDFTDLNGQTLGSITKEPAFFEGRYKLETTNLANPADSELFNVSLMLVTLMQRLRG
jgi:uncharacterized protein YxjI